MTEAPAQVAETATTRVWRVEVRPLDPTDDPLGRSVLAEAGEMHLAPNLRHVRTARLYLVETDLDQPTIERVAGQLLSDPVSEQWRLGAADVEPDASLVEVHYLPGVMDPVAHSTRDAILDMVGEGHACEVRTAARYDLAGATAEQADAIGRRLLANPVIQSIHDVPRAPERFPEPRPYEFNLIRVPIRALDDAGLARLSREGHLFLSPEEMRAIQAYYRDLGREPTDVELETLAQTWSEHCVHKTLKSRIRYAAPDDGHASAWADRPGHALEADGSLVIDNLLRSTIAAATNELRDDGVDWCISVFVDNAGIIEFDADHAATFKVETHNHPSAIEPYGGAATGIGGVIRDTMGCGLCAKPIANTDVFCVAFPDHYSYTERADGDAAPLPKGVLHPRRILKQIVAGVRDYGNRMGIPTVNGTVSFDDRYLGNPLVFAGSVGLIPRGMCFGDPKSGDRIIVLGGRTGRDGIHGATFSSAELTDTHADEFSHAVQIGNAITEKKMLDVILQARDHGGGPLFTAITDCGAGGFSSAVGEMGEQLGAFVQLENAPLKYEGLSYTEIWISEAQERMVLAVPPANVAALTAIAEAENVEWCDLGHYGTDDAELVLTYAGEQVGRMSMAFLHDGIPQPTRRAEWTPPRAKPKTEPEQPAFDELLLKLLGHPNIASKHWIVRQYDHEVQGGSAVKPLMGRSQSAPADAAVIRPKLSSQRGLAVSCGLATPLGDVDPYWMTLAAIDEAVRNAVCAGARAERIAILDNFCWPNCEKPENLGALVRAAEACYDGAKAYRTPFISGKDSLNNEFRTESGQTIAIPPTLLISAVGVVDDVSRCMTMDARQPGGVLIQIGQTDDRLGGSHVAAVGGFEAGDLPRVDLLAAPKRMAVIARLIADRLVRAAHDCSEGGLLLAAAEMAFAGGHGVEIDLDQAPAADHASPLARAFAETPSRVIIEVDPGDVDAVAETLRNADVPFAEVGRVSERGRLIVTAAGRTVIDLPIDQLRETWRKPLDW